MQPIKNLDLNAGIGLGPSKGMPLYHGSKGGVLGKPKPLSREKCDFGRGMYLGTFMEQAFSICIFSKQPHFYTCSLDLYGLNTLYLDRMSWVFMVGYCRGELEEFSGTRLYESLAQAEKSADVIVGDIADDSIYPAFESFIEGILTDQGLKAALSMLKLGQQYTLKTEKACEMLKLTEVALTDKELERLFEYDKNREEQSHNILREVLRLYSHVGLRIDDYYQRGIFNETYESL